MLQTNKLVIYPTSRAIRARIQDELKENGILPKIITIGEFEKKALVVLNRVFIDQDERTLLLNKASAFSTFKNLHIDREFFTFLKNSRFLFSFFDELSVEMVEIDELASFDTYASYSEHIDILSTLLQKYKLLLEEKNYVDKITLPSLYKLNIPYIKTFEEIDLHLEGYLNNFEFKFLFEIAQIVPLTIHLKTNNFNTKMLNKFKEYDIELKNNHQYIINLSDKSIISEAENRLQTTNYETYATQNQIMQTAYIKKKIYDFTNQGIEPKDIAVILPNGSFSQYLDLFDDENNFNFAMGFSYQKTELYQKFQAMYDYYSARDLEGRFRLQRLEIDIEKLQTSYELWNKKHTKEELVKIFTDLVKDREENEETKIYLEEFHLFSKLLPNLLHQPFHKIFHLFLNRLSKRTIDDTRGGKITVLEVLETRGISFKAVVIVDFNEGIVPLTSQKDLFLSSELRFLAGLPTSTDRENLQKYYYQRVFDEADEVAISYVEDEQNQPSRFLDELNIPKPNNTIAGLDTILFTPFKKKRHFITDDLIMEYDFSKTKLSATALKSYLDCERSYYFQYIKKITQAEIPKEDNSDRIIGILLHDALKRAYEKKDAYFDKENLLFEIQSYLYQESEKSVNLRFLVDLWMERLKLFVQNEIKRFQDGYRVKYVEKTFSIKHDDFTLTGKIDRIDIKENYLEVIDYKSGKIPKDTQKSLEKCSNFQLQFYHLLTSSEGEVFQSYYYDLNNANLVHEEFFDQKLDLLYQKLELLKNKEHNFTMTEDLKKCTFCPYIKICNRLL
jgi:inactivated superfamily I helicase